jgi:hypothetical protein
MGMIAVNRIRVNKKLFRGNLYLAKINPARLEVSKMQNMDPSETTRELNMYRTKSSLRRIWLKFSRVSRLGRKRGGQTLISAGVFKAVVSTQRNGTITMIANIVETI